MKEATEEPVSNMIPEGAIIVDMVPFTEQEKQRLVIPQEVKPLPIAINIYWDSEVKKFIMISIEYNLETNECTIINKEEIADSLPMATYKLNQLFNVKLLRGEDRV